jgi:glycosyltransferase involved in cell wall biosynthesis
MTPHREKHEDATVVHVIPSPRGRGAQRAARLLVDSLNGLEQSGDEPEPVRHCLLGLFEDTPEVPLDMAIGRSAGRRTAEGFDPRLALTLRKILSELDPVAVVAHGGDAAKYAVPALFGIGCPLVYCVIGTYAGRATTLQQSMWRRIMARAALVVAVGQEVLDECTGRFGVDPRRATMIPNGRDAALFHPAAGTPGPAAERTDGTLAFVGALTPGKQPDRYVEVVRRLRADGRNVKAFLAGDGPLASMLRPLADTSGVELLGPRSDVPELLRGADVFVFTSRPTGEGMPGVLIEAGLSGLPAVSTPVPGASAVLDDGHTGLIVPDAVPAIAAAVGQLLDAPGRRADMGRAARARCESEFSLDRMAQRWRTALRPLVDSRLPTVRRA